MENKNITIKTTFLNQIQSHHPELFVQEHVDGNYTIYNEFNPSIYDIIIFDPSNLELKVQNPRDLNKEMQKIYSNLTESLAAIISIINF